MFILILNIINNVDKKLIIRVWAKKNLYEALTNKKIRIWNIIRTVNLVRIIQFE